MSEPLVFVLPEQFDIQALLQRFDECYSIDDLGSEQEEKLYLDTWEWHLFHKGMVMNRDGIQYTLRNEKGESICCKSGSRKKYPFWWDFNDIEFRRVLKTVSKIRAFIPLFTVSTDSRMFVVRNSDEKIVLRLQQVGRSVIRAEEERRMLDDVLLVEPLRGYTKSLKHARRHLKELGIEEYTKDYNLLSEIHDIFGIDPNASDAKFSVNLAQSATTAEVTRDICLVLRSAMLRNLPGILEDIDSEFLHDFRVSVRRTRSFLSLMKTYLPTEERVYFQQEFKWLGEVTGPVRDLDVYLLKRDEYRDLLPVELYPGLDWFFTSLARQRKRHLHTLRENLQSDRFLKLVEDWQQFLLSLPQYEDYPAGRLICRQVVEKVLKKRFKRLLRDGREITPESPEENLHKLRIEGKKFRYLLEFYRSLFNGSSVDAYLKQMKRLQNNLGDFNDFSVQQKMLLSRLEDLKPGNQHSIEIAAALGGLIVHLGDRQRRVRKKFEATFASFATVENVELLESIFDIEDNPESAGGHE